MAHEEGKVGTGPGLVTSDEDMDSADCDEKKTYTPQPERAKQSLLERNQALQNHSYIGFGPSAMNQSINSVYKTQNMQQLSQYVNRGDRPKVDYNSSYHLLKLGGKQALIENKGSKCLCNKVKMFYN